MHFRASPSWCARRAALALACVVAWGCAPGDVLRPEYEYEEEMYLALDGSATVSVYATVRSLVALRGAPLDPDPRARVDRDRLRTFFGAPDAEVTVSLGRRGGERMVYASVHVDELRELSRMPAFRWSGYEFSRRGDVLEFRQDVGEPAAAHASTIGWTGDELVAFRMHLPSAIVFHNAPSGTIERGNILEWEQPLAARLEGVPVEMRVQLEPTSILVRTLALFGMAIAAAAITIAAILLWVSRRGREA